MRGAQIDYAERERIDPSLAAEFDFGGEFRLASYDFVLERA